LYLPQAIAFTETFAQQIAKKANVVGEEKGLRVKNERYNYDSSPSLS
jgi:hypothetical protein